MNDQMYFYGSEKPDLFAIERAAMDKSSQIIQHLNQHLPQGKILDIGAGNGYTASHIKDRTVICLEPSSQMVDYSQHPLWTKGSAENLPFHDNYFDGAYSTFAYFLPGVDKTKGWEEALRVTKSKGKIIIVDNAGEDEFCSFAARTIAEGPDFYLERGCQVEYIQTHFEFENLEDAEKLMTYFFGKESMAGKIKLKYEYKVAVYTKIV